MKKSYTVIGRTKAEYGSNAPAGTVAPVSYSTFAAAKAGMQTALAAATTSYIEIYGPIGLVARRTNPGGA